VIEAAPTPTLRRGQGARDFRVYWAGQTVSALGTSFTTFALPLLVFKLTGSALLLGLTSVSTYLPYLLFGLVSGAVVDRVDRKRLMVVVDLTRAVGIATIPLMAALGLLTVWWIYGVAFLQATLAISFRAGGFAALPSLVEKDALVSANGRLSASYSAVQTAGPLLAGALVLVLPLTALMVGDAVSFLVSVGSLLLIRRRFNAPMRRAAESGGGVGSILRDVRAGLAYVLGHPVLRLISLMMALFNLFYSPVISQLVFFAKHELSASDSQVSWLFAAGGVGTVALSLSAGRLRKRWSFSVLILGTLMVNGLLIVAFSLVSWYWIALPIWGITIGLNTLFNINTLSLRQGIVPDEMLGRVITIASVLAWSVIPLGALIGGLIIQVTGRVDVLYTVAGALIFLIAAAFSLTPLGRTGRSGEGAAA
jgi:MFS family permease